MHGEPVWDVDPEEHAAQLDTVLELTEPESTVLDLGAGSGRIAVPLAEAGRIVIAVDRDGEALAALGERAPDVRRYEVDVLDPSVPLVPPDSGVIDAAVCVGNTFALIREPSSAASLLRRLRPLMAPGAVFAIDDFPLAGWAELIEGNWQSGVSDDGEMQLVWSAHENLFAVRTGEAIDPECWELMPDDAVMRLWTLGELELLGMLTGFSPPEAPDGSSLVLMRAAEHRDVR
ncbi:MAG: class I SAM-dependent methyltransferase [Planctomycetota bacterium]